MKLKPDYAGGSIVNLMSTLAMASGTSTPYTALESPHLHDLQESENIVLLIIDGLGHNYLKAQGTNTFLHENVKGHMTSIFLPSTGCAISTFLTGVAPQQHAITGWYVHLPEYGIVSRYLPFTNAIDGNVLGGDIKHTIDVESILSRMNRRTFTIMGKNIVNSVYSRYMSGNATRIGYNGIDEFFEHISQSVASPGKSYVHAYWPEFDAIAHLLGVGSQEAYEHLHDFDQQFKAFVDGIEDTTLIVTSDHGFNDADSIYLHDHPKLQATLMLPLCGDTRTVFCYVRQSQVDNFTKYVDENLGEFCEMRKSLELIDEGWFGLGDISPRLTGRVGDYTLMMNEGIAMMNSFPGFAPFQLQGHHGGVSEDEMIVPLIVLKK